MAKPFYQQLNAAPRAPARSKQSAPTEPAAPPTAGARAPPLAKMLLSADDLRDLGIRYSRSQLHKQMQIGAFPKAVRLSTQRNAWVAEEIYAWLDQKMAERAA